jgi:hypothetical protein
MRHVGLSIVLPMILTVACSGETDSPAEVPLGDPEASEIVLQAVDAGTGASLSDDRMTVRYLVRSPITLDASAAEQVPSGELYRIAHPVAEDRLVVELRLEAPSYHRLDTVLSVARGSSAGPFTIRMARRLDRVAGRRSPPTTARPTSRPTPADPDAGIDRTALRAGDRAFQSENWAAASSAYARMEAPPRKTGTYAAEYARALVNKGISHINLGEWGGALDALEEAVGFESAGSSAFLRLTRAQCSVGRTDAGRKSLIQLAGRGIPAGDRASVLALVEYERAMCSQYEFGRAKSAIEVVRAGGRAIQEFNAFIELGEAVTPSSTEVDSAVADARRRVAQIRERMRQLRG